MKPRTFWFIPGYSDDALIAIKVKVEEGACDCDDLWVDEPIGHAVSADRLMKTRREAITELKRRIVEAKKFGELAVSSDLSRFREESEEFIASTWEVNGLKWPGLGYTLDDKKEGIDWFGPQHLK